MSKTSDFIAKITEKLCHDRELQLDVTHELQTHLDEAIAEYKSSEYSEEDAIAAAIKDMGDAEELAEDLWQSNRSRMKFRAWCWWIARLTLWPMSVLVTLAFIISGIATNGMMQEWGAVGPNIFVHGPAGARINDYMLKFMRTGMTEDQKLIAFGDESVSVHQAKRWKVLVDRWPDEPLYQINYLVQLIDSQPCEIKDGKREEIIAALNRGRQLEPNNGMYDLIAGCLLLPQVKYDDDPLISVDMPGSKAGTGKLSSYSPQLFQESQDDNVVREMTHYLHEAIRHDYITLHHFDMLRHRMAQLPPPRSMREYFWRIQTASSILLPNLGWSRMFERYICTSAINQAKGGNVDLALQWLDMLDVLQQKLAASSECAIELLVVQSCVYMNQTTRMFVHKIAGNQTDFEITRKQATETWMFYEHVWREPIKEPEHDDFKNRAGVILGLTASSMPNYRIDPAPARLGEYAMIDRAILSAILTSLVLMAGLMSTMSVMRMWFSRDRDMVPVLIWPGVRRLVRVLCVAGLLPMGAYGFLSQTPLFGRSVGVMHNPVLLLGPMMIGFFTCMLIWGCSLETLRKRAMEIGITSPSRRSHWHRLMITIWMIWIGLLLLFLNRILIAPKWIEDFAESFKLILILVIWFTTQCLTWFVLGLEYTRMRGIEQGVSRVLWGMICVFVVWIAITGIVAVAGMIMPASMKSVVDVMGVLGWIAGIGAGFWYISNGRGTCRMFYLSAIRSMATVVAICAIFLAVTAGLSLHGLEAHYARLMVKQSPILLDLEISHSNGQLLQKRLAGDQKPSARMVVEHAG